MISDPEKGQLMTSGRVKFHSLSFQSMLWVREQGESAVVGNVRVEIW